MSVWFDPHNIDHCRAYRHLQNTGQWPEGIEFHEVCDDSLWQVTLMKKITKAWIEYMLEGDSCPVLRKMEAENICDDISL